MIHVVYTSLCHPHLISFYDYLHLALYYFFFFLISMLMSNWNMINTFVSNLGTSTVLVFVSCELTYCIKFTKFVYLFFPFFEQEIFVFIIFEQYVVVLIAYVKAVALIVWVSRS